MSNPQPPDPGTDDPAGPVPVDNQPGHHPAKEQDKPSLDAFAAKLGIVEAPEREDSAPAEVVSRKITPAAIAGVAAGVLAAVLGLLAVRRRRAR